jgi:streptogramin lyase
MSFPAPTSQTNGLAWDGQYLWHSNERQPIMYKIDPTNGEVVGSITTKVPNQGDITWLDGSIWVNSEDEHAIYRIDPNNGSTIKRWFLDVGDFRQMEGMATDGRFLWANGGGEHVFQIDPVSEKIIHRYTAFFGGYADGFAYAWGSLFMSTNSTQILEIDPCSGGIHDFFNAPSGTGFGPEGMTFDGENLWYADNTEDIIYKIRLVDDFLVKRAAIHGAAACTDEEKVPPDSLMVWEKPDDYIMLENTVISKNLKNNGFQTGLPLSGLISQSFFSAMGKGIIFKDIQGRTISKGPTLGWATVTSKNRPKIKKTQSPATNSGNTF